MEHLRLLRGGGAGILAGLLAARLLPFDPVAVGIAAFIVAFLGLRLGRYGGALVAAFGLAFVTTGVLFAILAPWIPWHFCCRRITPRTFLLLDPPTSRLAGIMAAGYAALLAGGVSYVRGVIANEPVLEPRWPTMRFTVESETPDHVAHVRESAVAGSLDTPADPTRRPADSPAAPP